MYKRTFSNSLATSVNSTIINMVGVLKETVLDRSISVGNSTSDTDCSSDFGSLINKSLKKKIDKQKQSSICNTSEDELFPNNPLAIEDQGPTPIRRSRPRRVRPKKKDSEIPFSLSDSSVIDEPQKTTKFEKNILELPETLDAKSIREYAFNNWKTTKPKEKSSVNQIKKSNKGGGDTVIAPDSDAEKKDADKPKKDVKFNYNKWLRSKKSYFEDLKLRKRREEELVRIKDKEELEKQEKASKAYEQWLKNKKEEKLRMRINSASENTGNIRSRNSSISSRSTRAPKTYEQWKKEKEESLKEEAKKKTQEMIQAEFEIRKEIHKKEQLSWQSYRNWQTKKLNENKKTKFVPSSPWKPPSRSISFIR